LKNPPIAALPTPILCSVEEFSDPFSRFAQELLTIGGLVAPLFMFDGVLDVRFTSSFGLLKVPVVFRSSIAF